MMNALVALRVNQHTKFEVRSFTDSKDMIRAKLKQNGSRDSEHTHYGVVCHQKPST